MSFFVKLTGGGDPNSSANTNATSTNNQTVRTKEEERALRLAALAGSAGSADGGVVASAGGAGSKRKESEDGQQADPALPTPPLGSNSGGDAMDICMPPPPPTLQKPKASPSASAPLEMSPKPGAEATNGGGTPSRIHTSAIALNLALEGIFHFSLRPDACAAANALESGARMHYMGPPELSTSPKASSGKGRGSSGGAGNEGFGSPSRTRPLTESMVLTADNVTELIANRLDPSTSRGAVADGAINYLVGCYKRAALKESAGLSVPEIKEALGRCKMTIVNYAASALEYPDMFGKNSENSVVDLINILVADEIGAVGAFLKELAEELSKRDEFTEVVKNLLEELQKRLNALPVYPPVPPFTSGFSIMSNLQPLVQALLAFCRCHKSVASQVAQLPKFSLSPELSNRFPAPRQQVNMYFLMPPPRHGGAALEGNTLLGKLLSAGVDFTDTGIKEMIPGLPETKGAQTNLENNIQIMRSRLMSVQHGCAEIVTKLLMAQKATTLEWLTAAVEENAELDKHQPTIHKSSSRQFMLNLCSVLMQLFRPIISGDEEKRKSKLANVNWKYLTSSDSARIVPKDLAKLVKPSAPGGQSSGLEAAHGEQREPHFNTVIFFLCWRGMQLGMLPLIRIFKQFQRMLQTHEWDALRTGVPRAVEEYQMFESWGVGLHSREMLQDALSFCAAACSVLLSAMGVGSDLAASSEEQSLLPASSMTKAQSAVLSALPDAFMDVLLSVALFAGEFRPEVFNGCDVKPIINLTIFFLRRPWAMSDPHLRAMMGKLLHNCFLPQRDRSDRIEHFDLGNWLKLNRQTIPDGAHTFLMAQLPEAQRHLAPTMLLLYGDVEKTGYYDKVTNRQYISVVLRYLWSEQSHRSAFRKIVTDSKSGEEDSHFVKFAAGALDATNSQFASLQQHMSTIQSIRGKQGTAEWGSMTDERREEDLKKLREAEHLIKSEADLILEVLGMVNYLSSDSVIRQGFLYPRVLGQFTSCVLNVILNLTGKQSLQFKLDDSSALGFEPKQFLVEVCHIIAHVAEFEVFRDSTIGNGYFQKGDPLQAAAKVVRQFNLASDADKATLDDFVKRVRAKADSAESKHFEELLSKAPEQYLDPITNELMTDPVRLPTGNNVVDRSTIESNQWKDPFTSLPVSESDVVSLPDLKQEIVDWKEAQRQAAIRASV